MKNSFKVFQKSILICNLLLLSKFSNAQISTIDNSASQHVQSSGGFTSSNNNINTSTFKKPELDKTNNNLNNVFDSLRTKKVYTVFTKNLFEKFKKAHICYNDSTIERNLQINISTPNYYSIHEKTKGTIKMSSLYRVVIENDSTKKDFIIFQNGYRGKENRAEEILYQVLAAGKIELLMKNYALLDSSEILSARELSILSKEIDILYVYLNKKLEEVKFKKDFFFEKFHEEKLEIMEKFVRQNNINFKKVNDLVKLVRFYNNLFE